MLLIPLGNLYLQAPVYAHALIDMVALGLALTLLATRDRSVFRRPIGPKYWQELVILLMVMVTGCNLVGYLVS